MAPGDLEQVLSAVRRPPDTRERLLASLESNEDAAIVRLPSGMALVQSLDFLTPIVNDPYTFGRIAAANALSDIYAMGGVPWSAMNIACFPSCSLPGECLGAILQGGADAVAEAGAVMAGGHTVQDEELKYGLSVTGLVEPGKFAVNSGLAAGDRLILTKPLGSGILATAVKARWDGHEHHEREIARWGTRLNAGPGTVIRELGLRAATDITGFGLGGHLLEMARASKKAIHLESAALPAMPGVLELASVGLVPQGSHANRAHAGSAVHIGAGVAREMADLLFDAQTSGGLVLAVPQALLERAMDRLQELDEKAFLIGEVLPLHDHGIFLYLD